MVNALGAYLKAKCFSFVPLKEKCTEPEDQRKFAKYLGKYAPDNSNPSCPE